MLLDEFDHHVGHDGTGCRVSGFQTQPYVLFLIDIRNSVPYIITDLSAILLRAGNLPVELDGLNTMEIRVASSALKQGGLEHV